MNATCIQEKQPEKKRRIGTPLATVTSCFQNEQRSRKELAMKGPQPTFVKGQRDITESRRKQQNLLRKFEATVNMVTTTNDSNMSTQSVQLEDIDELELDTDKSNSCNSPIQGKTIL